MSERTHVPNALVFVVSLIFLRLTQIFLGVLSGLLAPILVGYYNLVITIV